MAFQTKAPWYANGTITSDGTTKIVGFVTNWADVGAISLGDMLTLDGLSFYQIIKIGDGTVQGDGSAGTASGTQAGNNTIIYVDRVVVAGAGQAYGILQLSAVNPINSDIAYKVSHMVQSWQGREDELIAWLAGTTGTFTLTDAVGVAYQVKCPAQMQADVDAMVAAGNASLVQSLAQSTVDINAQIALFNQASSYRMNPSTVTSDLTIPDGYNAYAAGSLDVAWGININVGDAASLTII